MKLESMTDEELERSMMAAVRTERESTTNVLHHLCEVEVRKLYCTRRLSSLFAYATTVLGYSEDQAARRISAMRLMRELPAIEEKIESGALTLSHLNKAQEMFRRERKAQRPRTADAKLDLLSRIEQQPIRQVQKTLELETYAPEPKKAADPISIEQFPAELQAKFKRLFDVRSHALGGNDLIGLIDQLAELGLEKWDQVRKAARNQKAAQVREVRAANAENEERIKTDRNLSSRIGERNELVVNAPVPATSRVNENAYISASARQQVFMRDGGCCTNCGSSRNIQVDHVVPPLLGGASDVSNLRLLCRSCNLRHAVQTYGRSKMQSYVRSGVRSYRFGRSSRRSPRFGRSSLLTSRCE